MVEGNFLASRLAEKAISDEWFAHFQYWIGSTIVDPGNEDVIAQLVEHSSDEYDHASELAWWVKDFSRDGRLPFVLTDVGRAGMYQCGPIIPKSSDRVSIVKDNLKGERCAVEFYTGFLEKLSNVDSFTADRDLVRILESILEKEKEHVSDLEKLLR
jgi:bacterioferritin